LRPRRVLAGLAVASSLTCSRPDAPVTRVDLATLLPTAEPWAETTALDLGHGGAADALVSGWAAPPNRASEFLLGSGAASVLAFRRLDGRAFRLDLLGSALSAPADGKPVTVAVNGVEVGRIRLGAAAARIGVEVPAGAARPGVNRLELRYPAIAAGKEKRRRPVAAWRGVRFGSGEAVDRAAGAGAAPGSLGLPAGTGIDFYLQLAGGARLELAGIAARGGAKLDVDLECDGEPPHAGLLGTGSEASRIELRARGEKPDSCRLTLRAVSPASGPGGTGVTVATARVVQPASARAVEPSAPTRGASAPTNLLVYIVDTLRADRLGCYGDPQPLTPAIDAFAREGVLFEHARAQSSWTRPTVATMLTGLTPVRLGTISLRNRLPAEVVTLPERLRERGYRTAYVTANSNTAAAFGFDQGVEFFRQIRPRDRTPELGVWTDVHAAGREFLAGLAPGERFLLVLHVAEPHAPYLPTERNRRRWAPDADPRLGIRRVLDGLPLRRPDPAGAIARQVRALYDAEVAGTDEGFAELVAELRRAGRLDDTAILFVADHGEELFEHGNVEHGRTLFEEQLRIPMIWRLPGGRGGGRRIASRVDQLDVTPTLLELAGAPVPPELPGRSLAGALAGGPTLPETSSPAWLERMQWHLESLVDGNDKLIRNLVPRLTASAAEERLYHLDRDPGERRPIRDDADARRGFLRAQLRFWRLRSGSGLEGGDAVIDEQLRQELRALGYLN
jgi:arylsulfatase A-like enzyme